MADNYSKADESDDKSLELSASQKEVIKGFDAWWMTLDPVCDPRIVGIKPRTGPCYRYPHKLVYEKPKYKK